MSAVPDNSLSDANVEAGPASCASVAQACAPNAGVSTSVAAVTSDAGLGSCPGIDQACARDGGALYHCVLDWASAQRPSTWCTKPNEFVSIYPDCDGYDIVEESPISSDLATDYYYDQTTGALVGVELYSDNVGSASCLAGSIQPVPLTDCSHGKPPVNVCGSPADASSD